MVSVECLNQISHFKFKSKMTLTGDGCHIAEMCHVGHKIVMYYLETTDIQTS